MSFKAPWTGIETISDSDGKAVCDVIDRDSWTRSEASDKRKKLSNLIRCAPDMLEGLEEIREYLTSIQDIIDGPDGVPMPDKAMQLATRCDHLIAKAKGFRWP